MKPGHLPYEFTFRSTEPKNTIHFAIKRSQFLTDSNETEHIYLIK